MKHLLFIATLLFSLSCAGFACAQEDAASAPPPAEEKSKEAPKDEYQQATYENLSKLYWAIGKMDLRNNDDIDNFLLINECEIYQRYINDDLEWEKIRDAARQMIVKDMPTYPTKFEVMIPVYLERYDSESQVFELADESKVEGTKNLDFAMNFSRNTCGKSGDIDNYPSNLVLLFSRPLTVTSFPATPGMAEVVIEENQRRYEKLPPHLQVSRFKRTAYLRVRVDITQYKETLKIQNRYLRAAVFTLIDGYEIYADPDKKILLYKEDFENTKRVRRVKKREDSAAQ